MNTNTENKRSSSVVAWLGLGISIFVLLLVLVLNFFLYSNTATVEFLPSIYVILFLVCGLLGIMGFILSLVGLVMAIKNFTPKWMGVSGIIISCLSLFCYFVIPFVTTTSIVKEPTEVVINEERETKEIVIQINKAGMLNCYVLNDSSGDSRMQFNMNDDSSKAHFKSWLDDNMDSNSIITLSSRPDVSYTNANVVMDFLNESGYNRFKLETETDIH